MFLTPFFFPNILNGIPHLEYRFINLKKASPVNCEAFFNIKSVEKYY